MKKFRIISILLALVTMLSSLSTNALTAGDITYYTPGNVYSDGVVNVNDVTCLQKYLAGITAENSISQLRADFNGDGVVNINDATEIQRMLVGLEYNSIVKPDYNYLTTGYNCGSFQASSPRKIEFETITESIETKWGIHNQRSVYLVTSKEQFFALTGYYSPQFDDAFFQDKALVMCFVYELYFEWDNSVTKMEIENDTLCITAEEYSWNEGNSVSPMAPTWNLTYSINKSDIEDISKIVCI